MIKQITLVATAMTVVASVISTLFLCFNIYITVNNNSENIKMIKTRLTNMDTRLSRLEGVVSTLIRYEKDL